jgi:hypothetical protein
MARSRFDELKDEIMQSIDLLQQAAIWKTLSMGERAWATKMYIAMKPPEEIAGQLEANPHCFETDEDEPIVSEISSDATPEQWEAHRRKMEAAIEEVRASKRRQN